MLRRGSSGDGCLEHGGSLRIAGTMKTALMIEFRVTSNGAFRKVTGDCLFC